MIKAEIIRSKDLQITGFKVKGHAGFSKQGDDIICASVSALCYTAAGYFDETRPDGLEAVFEEKSGYMKLEIPELISDEAKIAAGAVMNAWLIGMKQIELSYGGKYLKIIDKY